MDDPGQRLYLLLSLWVMDREHQPETGKEREISGNPLQ